MGKYPGLVRRLPENVAVAFDWREFYGDVVNLRRDHLQREDRIRRQHADQRLRNALGAHALHEQIRYGLWQGRAGMTTERLGMGEDADIARMRHFGLGC